MDIFIFNPDTDFALAKGRAAYTAPSRINLMRRRMSLTQLPLASSEDIILLPCKGDSVSDIPEVYVQEARRRNIRIMNISELPHSLTDDCRLLPWGWNHSLRRMLKDVGVEEEFLKPEEDIDTLRRLAHRRTTLPFREMMEGLHHSFRFPETIETTDADEALGFSRKYDTVYYKAPWSSSGRGIIKTGALPESRLREWIAGTIRRQGSVMVEEGLSKEYDFATEWWIEESKVRFLGYSMFEASPEGRYLSNEVSSQTDIHNNILSVLPEWDDDILNIQKKVLERLIAPSYDGPVGIDMLADSDLAINPCVEINLRQTMGMVALQRPLRQMLS